MATRGTIVLKIKDEDLGKKVKVNPTYLTKDEERINHYNEYERRNQINVISNTQMPNQVIKIELNSDGSVKKITKEFKND